MLNKKDALDYICASLKRDIDTRVTLAKEMFITVKVKLSPEQQQLLTTLVDSIVNEHWPEDE
jgi:hypothetical protein